MTTIHFDFSERPKLPLVGVCGQQQGLDHSVTSSVALAIEWAARDGHKLCAECVKLLSKQDKQFVTFHQMVTPLLDYLIEIGIKLTVVPEVYPPMFR